MDELVFLVKDSKLVEVFKSYQNRQTLAKRHDKVKEWILKKRKKKGAE
jgi:hypothetical protein